LARHWGASVIHAGSRRGYLKMFSRIELCMVDKGFGGRQYQKTTLVSNTKRDYIFPLFFLELCASDLLMSLLWLEYYLFVFWFVILDKICDIFHKFVIVFTDLLIIRLYFSGDHFKYWYCVSTCHYLF
jgi:hypothetical protein